jgi:uncharacterized DUF497 family protein
MEIIWEDYKRKSNLLKHGYDFADFRIEWLDKAHIEPTYSKRFKATVFIKPDYVVVIFGTLGKQAISIISMRDANKKERAKIL